MVSIASLKYSSIQHDVHLVNYGCIYFKIDDKAEDASGPANQERGLAMLTMLTLWTCTCFCVFTLILIIKMNWPCAVLQNQDGDVCIAKLEAS